MQRARASTVDLRPAPTSHGATITLGNIFVGAPSTAASVVVGDAASPGGEAVLESGRVQTALRRAGLEWTNASGQRRIIVVSRGGASPIEARGGVRLPEARGGARSIEMASASPMHESVLTYARALAAGEVVGAADVVWSNDAVAPSDAPRDADEVIGKAARRPLRPASAVGLHDLARPRAIRRDDLVEVAFEDDGVTLRLEAKALGDAAVGETLQVVNTQSKKVLEVVAAGPGRTVVGPAADALGAATADPALRLASR